MKARSIPIAVAIAVGFAVLASFGAHAAYSSAPVDQRPALTELAAAQGSAAGADAAVRVG